MSKIGLVSIAMFLLLGTEANAACKGREISRTGPNGKTLQICLDGKYSTCLRDSQRLGWSSAEAKRFCGLKRARGEVK